VGFCKRGLLLHLEPEAPQDITKKRKITMNCASMERKTIKDVWGNSGDYEESTNCTKPVAYINPAGDVGFCAKHAKQWELDKPFYGEGWTVVESVSL
jgi:hypothetical protein